MYLLISSSTQKHFAAILPQANKKALQKTCKALCSYGDPGRIRTCGLLIRSSTVAFFIVTIEQFQKVFNARNISVRRLLLIYSPRSPINVNSRAFNRNHSVIVQYHYLYLFLFPRHSREQLLASSFGHYPLSSF